MFSLPHGFFPAPDNFADYKKKLLKVFAEDKRCEYDNHHREAKTDYYYNIDNASYPSYLSLVTEAVSPHLQRIEKSMGCKLEIEEMWYQQSKKGQSHAVHTHGSMGFSAVWYVEFNPQEHLATTFYAPFNDPLTGEMLSFTPPVKEGDLIIFPSYLLHEQKENPSKQRRSIVSFNIMGQSSAGWK